MMVIRETDIYIVVEYNHVVYTYYKDIKEIYKEQNGIGVLVEEPDQRLIDFINSL